LHAFEVRELCFNIAQTVCGDFRSVAPVCTVVEPQQLRDFVEAESEALRRLDEAKPSYICAAVAADPPERPIGWTE
jgi:hypothetical protein